MTPPNFPDGQEAPPEASRIVLAMCDLNRGLFSGGVTDEGKIERVLLTHLEREPTRQDIEAALRPLLARSFLRPVPCPPPKIPMPAWPGVRQTRLADEPSPDRDCYAATDLLGWRAARLAACWRSPAEVEWLRSANVEDQILRYTDPTTGVFLGGTVRVEAMQVLCCLTPPDDVRAAIERLAAVGDLKADGTAAWAVTLKGEARRLEAQKRWRTMAATVAGVTAAVGPKPWTIDVAFVQDPEVRDVLGKMVAELAILRGMAAAALSNSIITIAGSIAEGLLYDSLAQRASQAQQAPSAPKGKANDLTRGWWTLNDYIKVADELGLIEPATAKYAHVVLREFRNMVHPKVQASGGLRPTTAIADVSVRWLEAVADELRGAANSLTP